jgi:hypothetical protein
MTVIRPETVFPSRRREVDEFDEEQVFSKVTQAQLPLADDERRLMTEPFGVYGGLAPRRQQRLVVVNEGDPDSDELGFRICIKCGKALEEGEGEEAHYRDYYVRRFGVPIPARCNGAFERVLLGYAFTSDILLVRVALRGPLRFGTTVRRNRKPLEDALQTLCEALTLSIGRVLDVDPHEVSAGFRFGKDGASEFADIFIYDTLSGGAGYALQAGKCFDEIFDRAFSILTECDCPSSCENCLRHYRNRFTHANLDRHLGADLAAYIRWGKVPDELEHAQQLDVLKPLLDLVKLAGWGVSATAEVIEVVGDRGKFRLAACPSLRFCEPRQTVNGTILNTFTPYELARDLPSAFAEFR